jgi:hypothetical protein
MVLLTFVALLLVVGGLSMGGDWRLALFLLLLFLFLPMSLAAVSTSKSLSAWRHGDDSRALRWHAIQTLVTAIPFFAVAWAWNFG